MGAGLLGLVAFFLMFGYQLYTKNGNTVSYAEFAGSLFGGDVKVAGVVIGSYKGAVISFVGYLLILLAGLGACALAFLKLDAKLRKIISLALGGVLVVGAVFVFIVGGVFCGVNELDAGTYHAAFCPIFAGILALLAAVATVASEFVPEKQLLK